MFGLDDEVDESSLVDALQPSDSASFTAFKDALVKKLRKYENSPHFLAFLDSLVKNLCLQITDVDQVRKISAALAAAEAEKRKEAKRAKKAGGGAAGKAAAASSTAAASKNKIAPKIDADALGLGGGMQEAKGRNEDAYDDLDDFM